MIPKYQHFFPSRQFWKQVSYCHHVGP